MIEHKLGSSSAPISMAVGDLNNDQRLDIVVANSDSNNIGIFFSYGNGTFENQTTLFTSFSSQPQSVAIGDFNNDNLLDIAVANRKSHNIGIFFGYGNKTFTSQMTISTGSSSPQSVGVGDFNNDSRLDVVVALSTSIKVYVLFGHGNGSFTSSVIYFLDTNAGPRAIVVDNFNNDMKPDIAVANYRSHSVNILFGYNNGSYASPTTYSTGFNTSPYSLAIGDFDNDSRLDFAVANERANSMTVFLRSC
ncbi:unnamed protein product [Rotaria sp. Silwood2]|nr:unnamed protein product [Rotaria sp. Silwood2]